VPLRRMAFPYMAFAMSNGPMKGRGAAARAPKAQRAHLRAGWVGVALRLGQDLEVLAPPWSDGEIAALLPEVVHRLFEFFDRLLVPQVDRVDRVRRRIAEEVASAEAREAASARGEDRLSAPCVLFFLTRLRTRVYERDVHGVPPSFMGSSRNRRSVPQEGREGTTRAIPPQTRSHAQRPQRGNCQPQSFATGSMDGPIPASCNPAPQPLRQLRRYSGRAFQEDRRRPRRGYARWSRPARVAAPSPARGKWRGVTALVADALKSIQCAIIEKGCA
jgi:hypothetical protein